MRGIKGPYTLPFTRPSSWVAVVCLRREHTVGPGSPEEACDSAWKIWRLCGGGTTFAELENIWCSTPRAD